MRSALFAQLLSKQVSFLPLLNHLLKYLKERSSSQRKELFKTIQRRGGTAQSAPVQLLIDMKIRWGSTHAMIKRALSCRLVSTFLTCNVNRKTDTSLQSVDTFIYEMGCLEESLEKCRKIDGLHLSAAEWGRVQLFEKLLLVSALVNLLKSSLTFYPRLLIKLNKHFPHLPSQHYATRSLLSRSYTPLGKSKKNNPKWHLFKTQQLQR